MRPLAPLAALALTAGALAMTPVAVDPAADATCTVIRGADTPDDDADDVAACRQDVWFHDAGTKVDNLDNAQGTFATWDTTAPATSVTGGAGGGVLANSALHQQNMPFDERVAFVANGSFDGAIDDLIVELYLFTPGTNIDDPANPVVRGDFSIDAQLVVDGTEVASLADHLVSLEPAGDAAQRITFAFRDVAANIELFHGFGATNALADSHEVEVRVHGLAIVSDVAVFVYDTTEVPAGMVFNPPAELLEQVD